MKVLAINGSSRKNGNTSILINTILKKFTQDNIDTEVIDLAENISFLLKAVKQK